MASLYRDTMQVVLIVALALMPCASIGSAFAAIDVVAHAAGTHIHQATPAQVSADCPAHQSHGSEDCTVHCDGWVQTRGDELSHVPSPSDKPIPVFVSICARIDLATISFIAVPPPPRIPVATAGTFTVKLTGRFRL